LCEKINSLRYKDTWRKNLPSLFFLLKLLGYPLIAALKILGYLMGKEPNNVISDSQDNFVEKGNSSLVTVQKNASNKIKPYIEVADPTSELAKVCDKHTLEEIFSMLQEESKSIKENLLKINDNHPEYLQYIQAESQNYNYLFQLAERAIQRKSYELARDICHFADPEDNHSDFTMLMIDIDEHLRQHHNSHSIVHVGHSNTVAKSRNYYILGNFRIIFNHSVPKIDCTEDECQDKYSLYTEKLLDISRISFSIKTLGNTHSKPFVIVALADGVSQASFSGMWAEFLVKCFQEYYLSQETKKEDQEWINLARKKWSDSISLKNLPWYARKKLEAGKGSRSTFLSLEIYQADSEFYWKAKAIGDTCLFVVDSEHNLLMSFPIKDLNEMPHIPDQIGTMPEQIDNKINQVNGNIQEATHFYLVTDTLAYWIFYALKSDMNPWQELNQFDTANKSAFVDWVNKWRNSNTIRLKNDDTTLIHISIE
jgi:hypothetical protein